MVHRLKVLRHTAAGALPGQALALLDPQRMLIEDVIPCEDGHAQERALLDQVLPNICKGDVLIDDRNFCTLGFLFALKRQKAYFITRQHAQMPCAILGKDRSIGRCSTGLVLHPRFREAVGLLDRCHRGSQQGGEPVCGAILGASGVGKTSVVNHDCRLRPAQDTAIGVSARATRIRPGNWNT